MVDHAKPSRADLLKAATRAARAGAGAGARAAREAWTGADQATRTAPSPPGNGGASAPRKPDPAHETPTQSPPPPRGDVRPDERTSRKVTEAEAVLRRRVEALKGADYKGGAAGADQLAGNDDDAHQLKVQDAVVEYVHALRQASGAPGADDEDQDLTSRLVRDGLNGLYLAGVWDGRTSEPGERSGM